MGLSAGLIILLVTSLGHCLPRQRTAAGSDNFVSDGTQDIAVAILQEVSESGQNVVFSPLGFASLLAAAAEGASGMTRRQLEWALRLPDDRQTTRSAYQAALRAVLDDGGKNQGLRSWLYIYKNFTVNDAYSQVLKEYYLTDVKNVDRIKGEPTSMPDEKEMEMDNGKGDGLKNPEGTGENMQGMKPSMQKEDAATSDMTNSEAATEDTKPKKPQETPMMAMGNKEAVKEDMKTQSMMSQMNMNEKGGEMEMPSENRTPTDSNMPSNEGAPSENHMSTPEPNVVSGTPTADKMNTTMKRSRAAVDMKLGSMLEDSLRLDAMDEKNRIEQAIAEDEASAPLKVLMSGLSANNFVRKTAENSSAPSQMLLFNGLYIWARWAVPFYRVQEPQPFYRGNASGGDVSVSMIRTAGSFRVANLTELDAVAVEIPYEGGQYSLLVMVPNARGGLPSLLSDLQVFPVAEVVSRLTDQQVEVLLPPFTIQTVTKPQRAFTRLGVTHLFNQEKADLSGISQEGELFVEDLAQVTNFHVEATNSTSTGATEKMQRVVADRPFAFFVRECKKDLLLVAGKVEDPTQPLH